jgi:hypothetical protein
MRLVMLIAIWLFFVGSHLHAQDIPVRDSVAVSIPVEAPTDTTALVQTMVSSAPLFAVYPVVAMRLPGAQEILTDSIVRWEQWLEYGAFLSSRDEVHSYRLGAYGRTDLFLNAGIGGRLMEVRLEGMQWKNPVTGQPRIADIPLERIGLVQQITVGSRELHDIQLGTLYSGKPVTRIGFMQTAYELRNTDARVSNMLNHRSGFELAYQGENNAAEFRRMATESRQMSARYFRHINSNWFTQAVMMYTGTEHQHSGGYLLPSLEGFNFSRFFANPLLQSADSRIRTTQAQLSVTRTAPLEGLALNESVSRFAVYYDRYKRTFQDNGFAFGYSIHQGHAVAEHTLNSRWAMVHGRLNAYASRVDPQSDLTIAGWLGYRMEVNSELRPGFGVVVPASLQLDGRSDGYQTVTIQTGVDWHLLNTVRVKVLLSSGHHMPEIGWLYSQGYVEPNAGLKSMIYSRGSVQLGVGNPVTGLYLSASGSAMQADHFTLLAPDLTYKQISGINQFTGALNAQWNHENWETKTSLSVLAWKGVAGSLLSEVGTPISSRTSVHWKGYVLSKAAYIKTGLTGVVIPSAVKTPMFHEPIDDWTFTPSDRVVPANARVDLDLSARVRNVIFLMAYENLLQGVGQLGYYETVPYPMPSRRFRFGLRVVFIN